MNQNNPTITTTVITSVFLMLIASIFYVVDSDPNTAIAYYKCDPQQWTSDGYGVVVEDLISDLAFETARQGYLYFDSLSLSEITVYGYAQCSYLIPYYDCSACLRQAGKDLSVECPMAVGAEMQLGDCYMKYSDSPLYGN